MPANAKSKPKTHKGLAKRVKITASGKIVRRRAGASHLLSTKSAKRRRNLRQSATVPMHLTKKLKQRMVG